MKLTIIALLLSLSGAAFATGNGSNNGPTNNTDNSVKNTATNTSTNHNSNYNYSVIKNEQGQKQGQLQGQSQTAKGGNATAKGGKSESVSGATATGGISNASAGASAGASSGGNTLSYTEAQQYRAAPDVFIGSPASGPCTGASGGFGLSVPGGSIALNTAAVSRACDLRELARVAAAAGRKDIADKALEAAAADLGLNGEVKPTEAPAERVTP